MEENALDTQFGLDYGEHASSGPPRTTIVSL